MNQCRAYTLTHIVEQYCIFLFNDKQKHFKNYLTMALEVWKDIFNNTLWVYESVWVDVFAGTPYPYIKVPPHMANFISIQEEIDCGGKKKLAPLTQTSAYSVIPKPSVKTCGCNKCDCGTACQEANSFDFEEKEVVIDGDTYLERTWKEVCASGDVIEWREVPTKEYDPEDMDSYEIVTAKFQQTLCKLEVKECGCVEDTKENWKALRDHCGCAIECNTGIPYHTGRYKCDTKFQFSDCGNKIFIIGPHRSQYLFNYQSAGAHRNSPVPDYAVKAVRDGIHHYSTMYNPSVPAPQKRMDKNNYDTSKIEILEFLNPADLDFMEGLDRKLPKW